MTGKAGWQGIQHVRQVERRQKEGNRKEKGVRNCLERTCELLLFLRVSGYSINLADVHATVHSYFITIESIDKPNKFIPRYVN